jgi:hypothetical protein
MKLIAEVVRFKEMGTKRSEDEAKEEESKVGQEDARHDLPPRPAFLHIIFVRTSRHFYLKIHF